MGQYIQKAILTIIVICIFLFALRTVWTKEIDFLGYIYKFLNNTIGKYIPTKNSEIRITPNKIILKTGKWQGTSSFNIHNSTQETLYNIYIKLTVENGGIDSRDIEVVPKDEPTFIQTQLQNISVKFDIVRITCTDAKGRECIILIIYSLLPEESEQFLINIKEAQVPNLNIKEAKISINSWQHSREPVQILSQNNNKVAFPINIPEKLIIKGVSFFMKKEQPK